MSEAHERRRLTDVFDARLTRLEADVGEVKDKLGKLDEVLNILNEANAAFRLASRIGRLVGVLIKVFAWVILPGVVLAVVFYAIAHDGHPPVWLKQWVELLR